MTLYAMITFAGPITGGCFNPAFGITQTTYQVGYMNSLGIEGKIYQRYLWIYCCSPLLGGIVASLFMRFVHNPNLGVLFKQEEMEELHALADEEDEVIFS
jgi:glycerol uptake facilitator-like aquaporin